ncbi:MAG TPA: sarcosine oxidase subunit delta [Alphaproteobacteria bacterium]|nr:sarcosine oxidase subunit delta [Alphaproteobacteria bacterium]
MKIINCPLNGPRNASEFLWGGEVKEMPDPTASDPAAWADYVFLQENEAGIVREWWCHLPTAFWFIAERDTRTDEILRTHRPSELFGKRRDFAQPKPEEGA